MKRYYYIILFIFSLLAQPLSAREFDGYTEEHPLIIACDWDFRPFEFLDSDGLPAGYNVELLGIILDKLNIPHISTSMARIRRITTVIWIYSLTLS